MEYPHSPLHSLLYSDLQRHFCVLIADKSHEARGFDLQLTAAIRELKCHIAFFSYCYANLQSMGRPGGTVFIAAKRRSLRLQRTLSICACNLVSSPVPSWQFVPYRHRRQVWFSAPGDRCVIAKGVYGSKKSPFSFSIVRILYRYLNSLHLLLCN